MTFTIEPMITLGTIEHDMWDDGWTVATKDKKWTAQFEHTIVVTDDGRGDPHPAVSSPAPSGCGAAPGGPGYEAMEPDDRADHRAKARRVPGAWKGKGWMPAGLRRNPTGPYRPVL